MTSDVDVTTLNHLLDTHIWTKLSIPFIFGLNYPFLAYFIYAFTFNLVSKHILTQLKVKGLASLVQL